MARVIITLRLEKEINKKFKKESIRIFKFLRTLENNPKKGKLISQIGSIVLKELKYDSHRFYFITNGFKLKILSADELSNLLIKFVGMSDKKSQQKVIDKIKIILKQN